MFTPLIRAGLSLVSPGGTAALSILIYHRVLPRLDPVMPELGDVVSFEAQISTLVKTFNVIPLSEAVQRLASGTLPPRAACITFDDGYADNHEVALPILKKYGVKAAFFIASGYLDGGTMWNDEVIEAIRSTHIDLLEGGGLGLGAIPLRNLEEKRAAIVRLISRLKYCAPDHRSDLSKHILEKCKVSGPTNLMMRSDQVRALRDAGMEIGCHTKHHPILNLLDLKAAKKEITDGREQLESICGQPVSFFAYPNGRPDRDYGPQHVQLVRELGFVAAVSTVWGAAKTGDDLFQLPRFTPWGHSTVGFQARLGQNILRSRLNMPASGAWHAQPDPLM